MVLLSVFLMLSRFPLGRCSRWFPERGTNVDDVLPLWPRIHEWTGPYIHRAPHSKWVASLVKGIGIGIGTNVGVIVAWLTTWEAHHSPRAKPAGCGELHSSLFGSQWPKLRYQVLFYYGKTNVNKCCQKTCSKISQNCPGYSMVTCAHLGIRGPYF